MDEQKIYEKYVDLLNSLKAIIDESQNRLLSDNPDPLFQQHLNFFIKAYFNNNVYIFGGIFNGHSFYSN